jgi:glycerol-3-phosphate cytidylyltransferase
MLEEAKQQCDYLIVALQTDPTIDRPEKNKPILGCAQ